MIKIIYRSLYWHIFCLGYIHWIYFHRIGKVESFSWVHVFTTFLVFFYIFLSFYFNIKRGLHIFLPNISTATSTPDSNVDTNVWLLKKNSLDKIRYFKWLWNLWLPPCIIHQEAFCPKNLFYLIIVSKSKWSTCSCSNLKDTSYLLRPNYWLK